MTTEVKEKMESVQSLTGESAAAEETLVTKEDRIKFAEHLRSFIVGRTDNEVEQEFMLKIAEEQFKGAPFNQLDDNCNTCHGRGFSGFNTTYGY